MKKSLLLLIGASALAGASFGLIGCVGGEVGVGVGVPAYYDDGPYFYGHPYYHEHNDIIINGGGGYRGGWDRGGRGYGGGHDHH